jgi:hypothetical protein
VLTAEQSAEVPEEDEHDGAVGPQVAEPSGSAGSVGQPELREGGEVHERAQ